MYRRRLIAALLALCSFLGGSGALSVGPALAALDVVSAEVQLLDLLNADRAAYGLPPLIADPVLMEIARWRSEDMLFRNFFGHDLGGFTIASVLRRQRVPFVLAGENLVSNTFDHAITVDLAHEELMRSASHRANILRPEFNLVGIGVVAGPFRRTIYTQIFVQAPAER